uniref:START domain-containing protein n=1 Tax=Anser brachyrhynchus TaxID=132585 RepID=A0A8B9BE64_9AVES
MEELRPGMWRCVGKRPRSLCRMECKDVPAETLYDVLHDIEYRKKWDTNVIETFDIGRLTVNSDVGYYAWKCPKPLKNRDVITLRSWLPMGTDYIIMNYSVKHPKYPPRKDMVRAVSIQTGYLVEGKGAKSSRAPAGRFVFPPGNRSARPDSRPDKVGSCGSAGPLPAAPAQRRSQQAERKGRGAGRLAPLPLLLAGLRGLPHGPGAQGTVLLHRPAGSLGWQARGFALLPPPSASGEMLGGVGLGGVPTRGDPRCWGGGGLVPPQGCGASWRRSPAPGHLRRRCRAHAAVGELQAARAWLCCGSSGGRGMSPGLRPGGAGGRRTAPGRGGLDPSAVWGGAARGAPGGRDFRGCSSALCLR